MGQAVVQLEGIEKDYPSGDGALTVLRKVDLCIERGDFVGIVGASGSGKSTLMNILGCLDRPTRGRYVLDGQDVSRLDDDQLSRVRNQSIGFVFQSFNLIAQFSVLENVEVPLFYSRVPRRERRERAQAVVASVGLSHRVSHLPAQLSGGECQRVAIARALVTEPALLLTDEPTGNLDSKNGEKVLRLFGELHESGRTLVMVTHNPDIARRLPRVVEMKDGRMGEKLYEEATA
ncbi:MAG: ABC transporter ATP-binding protein [Planctomycetes bacterium]|nr:ABC transporter ATP-binding protein [Planctomycetota bacterium]